VLGIYWGGLFEGLGLVQGLENCTTMFPGRHFLFNSSDQNNSWQKRAGKSCGRGIGCPLDVGPRRE